LRRCWKARTGTPRASNPGAGGDAVCYTQCGNGGEKGNGKAARQGNPGKKVKYRSGGA